MFSFTKRPKFEVCNKAVEVPFEPGDTVLDALLRARLEVHHECGGQGICGTCRVFVLAGAESLPKKNAFEEARSEGFGYGPSERLACQIKANSEVKIDLPEYSRD